MEEIKLSVRGLVEFIMRHGNIESGFGGIDRALEGARIHRKIQKAQGGNYIAEVMLRQTTEYQGILFTVEGRADGIFSENNLFVIDEIKTTAVPLHLIDENFNPLHWAQAKCYGYFYCFEKELSEIAIRLTYYHIETKEIKYLKQIFTFEDLKIFFFDLLSSYKKWAEFSLEWDRTRTLSAQSLSFPYDSYRKGQRAMAVAVYKTIAAKEKLFCQAPTGIGKTVSALFPAIKALGEKKCSKIFYLTAKTITRQAAADAILTLSQKNLRLKSVVITAKDKTCFLEKRTCSPLSCPYAKGHFDRVNDALYELLISEDFFSRSVIEKYAKKYQVCPYEFSLDLSLWCDCIVCDYNYAFDPQVYLRRFFSEKNGDYVFLIDEAHNLVDRAREMFSAVLSRTDFSNVRKELPKDTKKFRRVFSSTAKSLTALGDYCAEKGYYISSASLDDFSIHLTNFCAAFEEMMAEDRTREIPQALLLLYFNILCYLKIMEFYDNHYVTFINKKGKDVTIRLLCLDPSHLLEEVMKRAKSAILFSATLTPMDYFISILGGGTAKKLMLPSPYPQDRLGLYIANNVNTRYLKRQESLPYIASLLYTAVSCKKGNYIAYFPSYKYMQEVWEQFHQNYPQINTLLQSSGMTESEREMFLSAFDAENADTLLGFCVLGGIYAEGVDLKGDRLIGSFIIGVGLPQINLEQDIIKDYYNQQGRSGYDYAYTYPGMNKVLQAAGRVIRDENDKGIILLMDDRFASSPYKALFPPHWNHFQLLYNNQMAEKKLKEFWGL